VDDNVDTCANALKYDVFVNDVLNIGNDIEISILELAQTVIDVCNSKSEIIMLPALKEGDMRRRCPDNSKMKRLLNRDLLPLEQGLKNMVEMYKNDVFVLNDK
jgi:UDP-glucose 4-epimerase